jgi:hypothetical protein
MMTNAATHTPSGLPIADVADMDTVLDEVDADLVACLERVKSENPTIARHIIISLDLIEGCLEGAGIERASPADVHILSVCGAALYVLYHLLEKAEARHARG